MARDSAATADKGVDLLSLVVPVALVVAGLLRTKDWVVIAAQRINPASSWTYSAGQNAVSWFDTGFARRELAGTIIRGLGAEPILGTLALWGLSMAAVTILSGWIIWRARRPLLEQVMLAATALTVLVRLSQDMGRLDPTIMIFGLGAAWAARGARWTLCSAFLFVALLVHEASLIEFLPVIAAIAWASGSWRRWRTRDALGGAMIMALSCAAYVLSFHPSFDAAAIGRRVSGEFPDPTYAAPAAYLNLVGGRALADAQCMAAHIRIYPLQLADGVLLCLLMAFGLQPGRWRLALAATAPSFLALGFIAIDLGRWAVFAAFAVFLMAALLPAPPIATRRRAAALVALLSACALMVNYPGGFDNQHPFPGIENYVAGKGWMGRQSKDTFAPCAPHWRRDIGL